MSSSPFVNPFAKASGGDAIAPKGESGVGSSVADVESFFHEDDKDDKSPKKEENKNDDEEKPPKKDNDEDNDDAENDDNDDGNNEDDIELNEDDEDGEENNEDDRTEIAVPPKKKEILKAYPDFFKKFPAIEGMIYRDKEITELVGTMDDLKELVARNEDMSAVEVQLLKGDTGDVLKRIKEADPKAFDKVVDNYLETLRKIDNDAYLDVVGNFSKNIIKGMVKTAKSEGDDELLKIAKGLHKYLYGNSEWEEPKLRSNNDTRNEEREELENERKQFTQQRFETSRNELQRKVDNVLKSTISDHIDPRGSLSAYEKRKAVDDALNRLHDKIGQDTAYSKQLDRLWRAAFASNFSERSLNDIRKSYMGRSRSVLGGVLKEIRAEVMKGKGKPDKDEDTRTPREPRKSVNAGRPQQRSDKGQKGSRQPGESVHDFFMRD